MRSIGSCQACRRTNWQFITLYVFPFDPLRSPPQYGWNTRWSQHFFRLRYLDMLSSSPWSLWTIGQPNMLSFSWLSSGLMLYETGPCYLGGAMVIVTDDLAWPNKNTAMMASSRTLLDVEIWLFRDLHAHSFQSRPASFSPLPQPHTHTHTHTYLW